MSRLRRVNHMCSRTVSDPANRLLKRTDSEGSSSAAEEKSSAVPLFRSGHMSAICARLSKGKGRFTRGWKPQVSTLLCPRRVGALPLRFSENIPPVRGEHACGSSRAPVSRCRETGCRPAGTYESLRLNSSYPNIRTTSSVPSARRMAISGSGIPLNVLVLTMV